MNPVSQQASPFIYLGKGDKILDDVSMNKQHPDAITQATEQSKRLSNQLLKSQISHKNQATDDYFNYKPVLGVRKPKTKSNQVSRKSSANKENNPVSSNQQSGNNAQEKTRSSLFSPKSTPKGNTRKQVPKVPTESNLSKSISQAKPFSSKRGPYSYKKSLPSQLEVVQSLTSQQSIESETLDVSISNARSRQILPQNESTYLDNSLTQTNNGEFSRLTTNNLNVSRFQDHELLEVVLGSKPKREEEDHIPFQIATNAIATPRSNAALDQLEVPKRVKHNNFFDFSPKRKGETSQSGRMTARYLDNSKNLKTTHRKSSALSSQKTIFERKRLSDNTKMIEDKLNLQVEAKFSEAKSKKKQNVSVTTNASVTSHSPRSMKQQSTTSIKGRVSQGSKRADKQSDTQEIEKGLFSQTKFITKAMESLKKKQKCIGVVNSMMGIIQTINQPIKKQMEDKVIQLLIKLHNASILIQCAMLDLIQADLMSQSKLSDSIASIVLNSFDYSKKSAKLLIDLLQSKRPEKDRNPFSVGALLSASAKASATSKLDSMALVKQNIKIALAFIKKFSRQHKSYAEKLKDFLPFITQIEASTYQKRMKHQIVKVHASISSQETMNHAQNEKPNSKPQKTLLHSASRKERTSKLLQSTSSNKFDKCQSQAIIKKIVETAPVSPYRRLRNSINQNNLSRSLTKENCGFSSIQQVPKDLQLETLEPVEPCSARNNRHAELKVSQDKVQFCFVPPHISARASSTPLREPYLPSEIMGGQQYTLVLDLDETLVHYDARTRMYRPRPGALKFLSEMSKYYELVVFTAGLKDYADWILNDFDRQCFIKHRLYRDHCKFKDGVYLKDLSKLGRDLSKVIIVDNIEENFEDQQDNGIPIKSWFSEESDRELEHLTPFLKGLVEKKVKDVRHEVIQYKFMLLQKERELHMSKLKTGVIVVRMIDLRHLLQLYPKHKSAQQEGEDSENESSEDEKPQKKAQPAKKQQQSDSSSEGEEDSDEESEDDKKTQKKKPQPKKSEKSDSEDEEDADEEESEDEVSVPPKNQKIVAHKKSETEVKLERELKELKEQVEDLEHQVEEKDETIKERAGDIRKLTEKLLSQDQEISKLKDKCNKKKHKKDDIKKKLEKTKDKKKGMKKEIERLQLIVAQMDKYKSDHDHMKAAMDSKNQEIGVLKAKLNLDLIYFRVTLVPEYPDMVEDNNHLYKEVANLKNEVENYKKIEHDLKTECYELQEKGKEKDKKIKQLEREKENLQKKVKDHIKQEKQMSEKIAEQEARIAQHLSEMQKKNDELEERLETVSKLIQKNEQLSQQLRVTKMRLEKFKKEQVETFQKQLNDRDSEIEVLKEMVKGNQLEVRAKEKEIQRLKSKIQHSEGQQLALRQQQNFQQSNMSAVLPATGMSSQSKKLGQIRATPQRFSGPPKPLQGGHQKKNSTHFPPIDKQSEQMSSSSAQNSQKGGSQSSQYGGSSQQQLQKGVIYGNISATKTPKDVRQSFNKRIEELDEEDVEINHKFIPNSSNSQLRASINNDIDRAQVRVALSHHNPPNNNNTKSQSAHDQDNDESRAYSPDANHQSQLEDEEEQSPIQPYEEDF